jgi:hypothetical protein
LLVGRFSPDFLFNAEKRKENISGKGVKSLIVLDQLDNDLEDKREPLIEILGGGERS